MGNSVGGRHRYYCGDVIKYFNDDEVPDGWVRGTPQSVKQKVSESVKLLWCTEEYKSKQDKYNYSDEYKAQRSETSRRAYANSDVAGRSRKVSESLKSYYECADSRAKCSERMSLLWGEPEYRLRQTEALRKSHKGLYDRHPEYRDALSQSMLSAWKTNSNQILQKQRKTLNKNKSWNFSKPEERMYSVLCEQYGKDNVIRQYHDERYPFNCDFYIKSEDLFIELNAHWTHGGRPYDENDAACQEQLAKWREKAKTSRYYEGAIHTWVEKDVKKLQTARKSGINLQVIY